MKGKTNVLLCILVVALSCTSKEEQSKVNSDSVKKEQIVVIDTNLLKNKDESPLDFFVDTHADSINNSTSVGQLPLFLTEAQFDYQNAGILSSFHDPLPLRKLIINKVTNCASLKLILEDQSEIYRKKPQKQHDIEVEFINLSIYDLAYQRSKQLNCK
jgi:hypothetical protein